MADIRRRFGIEAGDEVTPIDGPTGRVFLGLPSGQATLLQELWHEGKVGFELASDVRAKSVTGVYGVYSPKESETVAAEEDLASGEVSSVLEN